jgi:hypothetical protein
MNATTAFPQLPICVWSLQKSANIEYGMGGLNHTIFRRERSPEDKAAEHARSRKEKQATTPKLINEETHRNGNDCVPNI